MANRPKDGFARAFDLISEEPFRLFFPAGMVLGLAGVSLWIFYYFGWISVYPGISHARLMIEGFMAAFIFGFLATAGPRLMDVPHFSRLEILLIFTAQLFAAGLHLGEAHSAGDSCFLAALLIFVAGLARRFGKRKDSPPPNFVLVGFGLASGIVGLLMILYAGGLLFSAPYQIGVILLSQCFVLLPILGVAPFFIRRLLDLPSPETSESSPRRESSQLLFALLAAGAILVSAPVEVLYAPGGGVALRSVITIVYMAVNLPWRARTPLAQAMRLALLMIAIGFFLAAAFPLARIGFLHVVFITGFNLIAFTVATRVVFGHSGNLDRLGKPTLFRLAAVLLFMAMLARVVADFSPETRAPHLISAAVGWLIASLLWMASALPKVTRVETEPG